MKLTVTLDINEKMLEGLTGRSHESEKIKEILEKELQLKNVEGIQVDDVIADDLIVHRLIDEDVEMVIDKMDEEIQKFFKKEDNFRQLCEIIRLKGEFEWFEDMEAIISGYFPRIKDSI